MQRFWDKVDKTESCWLWTGAGINRYLKNGRPARGCRACKRATAKKLTAGLV